MKRSLDLAFSCVILALLAPILVVIAVAIKLDSRGPILYSHRRVGKGGAEFTCFKFRSMHIGASLERENLRSLDITGGPAFKAKDDPRVSRLGRWLRRTSLDEVPQLLNVVRGEMSLVGPRPLPVEDYALSRKTAISGRSLTLMSSRLRVKPGLTCIWQVSGRSSVGFDEWMELDEEYIRSRSLFYDFWILLRTVPAVVSMRGAH